MALIKCLDCGRDVSDSAPSCPNCGRPFRQRSFSTSDGPISERPARKKSGLSLSRIMVFGAIGCLAYAFLSPSKNHPPEASISRQAKDPVKQAALQESTDSTNLGWYGGDQNIVSFDSDPEPSGSASCNVRISPGRKSSGQVVSIKSVSGRKSVDVELYKESWRIPAGSIVPVSLGFPSGYSITAQSRGFGNTMSFHIPVDIVPPFHGNLIESAKMTISFPEGDEPSWGIALNGVGRAMGQLGKCTLARIMKNSSSQPL